MEVFFNCALGMCNYLFLRGEVSPGCKGQLGYDTQPVCAMLLAKSTGCSSKGEDQAGVGDSRFCLCICACMHTHVCVCRAV